LIQEAAVDLERGSP